MTNAEAAAACVASKSRYDGLTPEGAKLAFSYDFQGYAASMVDRGYSLAEIAVIVIELTRLLTNKARES